MRLEHEMRADRAGWTALLALAALLGQAGRIVADDPSVALPEPSQVRRLEAFPPRVLLKGSEATQQMVITAVLADGRAQDLSRSASYAVADPDLARVSHTGRVTSRNDGQTTLI